MELTETMTATLRRFFKALDTSNTPLQSLQIFSPIKDFVDIGGVDVGRVKLSMLRIPYKTEEFEPILIEPTILLKILGKLGNEEFTIKDYENGVKLVCPNREMTFTETANFPVIKPYILNELYKDISIKTEYSIIHKETGKVLDEGIKTRERAERKIKTNDNPYFTEEYKHAEITETTREISHHFCEFTLKWHTWSEILKELNTFDIDTFNIFTEDGNIILFAEEPHYTYKRTLISLSECRKKTHIKSVTYALRNFDRRIKIPVKIQVTDNEPICLTFEDKGISLRQWIAPRINDEEENDE